MAAAKTTTNSSFSTRMGEILRYVLSCGERDRLDSDEESDDRPPLVISGPTNFRREEIRIDGLSTEQQALIRTKAITDAQKMYNNLRPLNSSPSSHFATADNPLPSYEAFTTPREAPSPKAKQSPRLSRGSEGGGFGRAVARHSRKISSPLSAVKGREESSSGGFEMKGLGQSDWAGPGKKDSADTWSVGEGRRSGDSGMGVGKSRGR